MKSRGCVLVLLLLVAACGSDPVAEPESETSLQLEVYTSSPNGFSVTSTLVYGESELLVIDPQFLLSEARQLADEIRATGRTLTTIYTTHAHPDHFFGVAALLEEFPEARYVALPEVAERMVTGWPARQEVWSQTYGEDVPGPTPILPEPLETQALMLEGHTFPITGEVMGDGGGNSFVHIPELEAVVAGDIIFNNSHFSPPADPAPLYETFEQIAALSPQILVAGHQSQGTPNDPGAMDFMRAYIEDFAQLQESSTSAEELETGMLERYPDMALPNLLEGAAGRAFPEE